MNPWWALIAISLIWLSLAYVVYPLIMLLLAWASPRPTRSGDIAPALSVIIAVHDGGPTLPHKLDATLALAYPGSMEIIVASDGSTDETESVARSRADRGVRLVRTAEHQGKEAAQAMAIGHASGEILVFTDLNAELDPNALRNIVRPFADPTVGCVSSEDVVQSKGGESAYVGLEMLLRRLESRASSLVGLSGSLFAVRRNLCAPWPIDLASDFRIALEAARRGFRAVSEPEARARFGAVKGTAAEWSRKVRTVRRGLAVLGAYRELLHPMHGRGALTLWGHKVTRFTSPFALVVLLMSSAAAAATSTLATLLLCVQLVAYTTGVAALASPAIDRFRIPRLFGFFLLVNASILVAWARHLSGRRVAMWQPTRR